MACSRCKKEECGCGKEVGAGMLAGAAIGAAIGGPVGAAAGIIVGGLAGAAACKKESYDDRPNPHSY